MFQRCILLLSARSYITAENERPTRFLWQSIWRAKFSKSTRNWQKKNTPKNFCCYANMLTALGQRVFSGLSCSWRTVGRRPEPRWASATSFCPLTASPRRAWTTWRPRTRSRPAQASSVSLCRGSASTHTHAHTKVLFWHQRHSLKDKNKMSLMQDHDRKMVNSPMFLLIDSVYI